MLYAKTERVPRHHKPAHAHMFKTINKLYARTHEPISTYYDKKVVFPSYDKKVVFPSYDKKVVFPSYDISKLIPMGVEKFKKYKPRKRKPLLPVVPRQLVPVISEETLIKAKEMGIFRSDFDIKKVLEL